VVLFMVTAHGKWGYGFSVSLLTLAWLLLPPNLTSILGSLSVTRVAIPWAAIGSPGSWAAVSWRWVSPAELFGLEELRKRSPTFEPVVDSFGDVTMAREAGAFLAHPSFQLGDDWFDDRLADRPPFRRRSTVNIARDIERKHDGGSTLRRGMVMRSKPS
jgi:hypothetical protein